MPALDLSAFQRKHDLALDILRRIQTNVLPRSRACLNRSDTLLSDSTARQLETTQKLLDPGLRR